MSQNIGSLPDLLKTLTPKQLDFLQARLFAGSDSEAAEQIGLAPDTVYRWANIATVRECVALAKQDGILLAAEKLRRAAGQAVDVLVDELEAKRGSRKRLDAAIEILNRTIGKPTERQEVGALGGGPLEIVVRHVSIPIPDHPSPDAGATSGS